MTRLLTKRNILRGLLEIVIVVIGVTIAFTVDQYREDINNRGQLKSSLNDIEKSLEEDSITIAKFSYDEIQAIITKIDSSIIELRNGRVPNLNSKQNIFSQPLMNFGNGNLEVFIKSESFNYFQNVELKKDMIFYKQFTADIYEKDMRLLDYLQNSVTPTIHRVGEVYGEIATGESKFQDNSELTKAINDLIYIRQEYKDRLHKILPYIIENNSRLRIGIKSELKNK